MNLVGRYSSVWPQAVDGCRHLLQTLAQHLSLRDTSTQNEAEADTRASTAVHTAYFGLLVDSHSEFRERRH